MCNFSAGFMMGTIMGVSIILAVHPMNKRSMKKAYHRAGRMVNRMGHNLGID